MAVAQGWIGIKESFLNSSGRFQKLSLDNSEILSLDVHLAWTGERE